MIFQFYWIVKKRTRLSCIVLPDYLLVVLAVLADISVWVLFSARVAVASAFLAGGVLFLFFFFIIITSPSFRFHFFVSIITAHSAHRFFFIASGKAEDVFVFIQIRFTAVAFSFFFFGS